MEVTQALGNHALLVSLAAVSPMLDTRVAAWDQVTKICEEKAPRILKSRWISVLKRQTVTRLSRVEPKSNPKSLAPSKIREPKAELVL